LAALTFSVLDLTVKVTVDHLTVWQLVFGRCLFGLAATVVLARRRGLSAWGQERGTLLASGVAGAGVVILLTMALRLLPLAEALILVYLFPAFAALTTPLLARERVSPWDWLWVAVSFAGAMAILWPGLARPVFSWGHLIALGASLCLGLNLTLIRRLRAQRNAYSPYVYYCLAGLGLSLGPLLGQPQPLLPQGPLAWAGLVGTMVLALGANLLSNKAVQFLSAPKVGVVLMIEVVCGAVLGLVFFAEPLGPRLVLGGALILAGGVCLVLNPPKDQ
jgi:drug/metabolite transporter (DMT)-like permease